MAGKWLSRDDAAFPFQTWSPFPPEAIVQIASYDWSDTRIGRASSFWWGWASGIESACVIRFARRLDTPKVKLWRG